VESDSEKGSLPQKLSDSPDRTLHVQEAPISAHWSDWFWCVPDALRFLPELARETLTDGNLRISENRDGYFAMSRSPVSESSGHLSVAELWEPGEGYGRLFSLFSVIVKDGMDFCLRMLSPLRVIRCAL
jgi:hypothetical protein